MLYKEFVEHLEKWILIAYPGKPLKSQMYFWQKNFFNLKNSQNAYENAFYDLDGKKLYDCKKIDLDKFKF